MPRSSAKLVLCIVFPCRKICPNKTSKAASDASQTMSRTIRISASSVAQVFIVSPLKARDCATKVGESACEVAERLSPFVPPVGIPCDLTNYRFEVLEANQRKVLRLRRGICRPRRRPLLASPSSIPFLGVASVSAYPIKDAREHCSSILVCMAFLSF